MGSCSFSFCSFQIKQFNNEAASNCKCEPSKEFQNQNGHWEQKVTIHPFITNKSRDEKNKATIQYSEKDSLQIFGGGISYKAFVDFKEIKNQEFDQKIKPN
jgi:hypothetical protein